LKREQVNKALWQNSFLDNIKPYIAQDKTIGINWDFNDDFLRFKTDKQVDIIWDKESLLDLLDENPKKWNHFIFSCWANCSDRDLKLENKIIEKYYSPVKDSNRKAYLLDLHKTNPTKIYRNLNKTNIKNKSTSNSSFAPIISIYRYIRDILFLEQI